MYTCTLLPLISQHKFVKSFKMRVAILSCLMWTQRERKALSRDGRVLLCSHYLTPSALRLLCAPFLTVFVGVLFTVLAVFRWYNSNTCMFLFIIFTVLNLNSSQHTHGNRGFLKSLNRLVIWTLVLILAVAYTSKKVTVDNVSRPWGWWVAYSKCERPTFCAIKLQYWLLWIITIVDSVQIFPWR